MSEEAIRKRKAREEKKAAQAAKLIETATNLDNPGAILVPEVPELIPQVTDTMEKGSSIAHTVVIPAASSSLDWYEPGTSCSYSTIAAARAVGIWDYPSTLQERAKCGVFRNLWEQGYFMGGGIKFGGDYLVYPGTSL